MANHPTFSTIERPVFTLAFSSQQDHFVFRISHIAN